MQESKHKFIQFAIDSKVLLFGSFTLKSGRISPYFFNTGLFNTGQQLAMLGQFYAQTIEASELAYDCLFGPAYKGIPLVSSISIALAEHHNRDVPYCFDRKEVKSHGEGGKFVGAPLKGRVLIVDDVVSAGTTSREMIETINSLPDTKVVGLAVALDRSERGKTSLSALQELKQHYKMTTINLINLQDIVAYLEAHHDKALIAFHEQMKYYQSTYGAPN